MGVDRIFTAGAHFIFNSETGPKFTDDLMTSLDNFMTYDNLMTAGEFTEHLR